MCIRDRCGSVRHVKGTVGFYLTSRIDLENAFFRHFDLVFSHRLSGGIDLPVDVGQTHAVVILSLIHI